MRTDDRLTHSGLRPTSSAAKQIRSKILQNHDDDQFLPQGDLESILSEELVDKIIVEALQTTETEAIVIRNQVCGNRSGLRRIKILATLILIEAVESLQDFLDHDVCDAKLPLSPPLTKEVFQKWEDSRGDNFRDRQYVVLAPVFDFRTVRHYAFNHKLRMPFLERLGSQGRGAHGTISRVKIHQDHQCWGPDSPPKHDTPFFALKKFRDRSDFEQEKEALKRFSCPQEGHKHLIKLLLSYERGDECFMIFPWAEGNLAQFWKKNSSKPTSRRDSYWFFQQCEGLASGLRKVHIDDSWPPRHDPLGHVSQDDCRNLGRHGDIKPENILWFKEAGESQGHLVVADFTLMRFHSMATVGDCTEVHKVGFSRTYCPPEVEAGPKTSVNQKYDIWTLGCVYLEFITWYLIGYDAIREDYFKSASGERLESFNIVRLNDDKGHSVPTDKFFNKLDGPGAQVKNSVVKASRNRFWTFKYRADDYQWIRMLHGKQHCSAAIHRFLDLIEKHMLVPVPDNRWSMAEVCNELHDISVRLQTSGYYHEGESRLLPNDDNFPPKFTNKSKQYRKAPPITTLSTPTSSPESQSTGDLHAIEEAFADETPLGQQPSKSASQGDASSSRSGDQLTDRVKRKAGQHLFARYNFGRRAPSHHNSKPEPSTSLGYTDVPPGVDLDRAGSLREASFHTTNKANASDVGDGDRVDLGNPRDVYPHGLLQVPSQPLRDSSGEMSRESGDTKTNLSAHFKAESQPGKSKVRHQLEADGHPRVSVRQRVSQRWLKRPNKGISYTIRRVFSGLWTKISG